MRTIQYLTIRWRRPCVPVHWRQPTRLRKRRYGRHVFSIISKSLDTIYIRDISKMFSFHKLTIISKITKKIHILLKFFIASDIEHRNHHYHRSVQKYLYRDLRLNICNHLNGSNIYYSDCMHVGTTAQALSLRQKAGSQQWEVYRLGSNLS